MTDKHNSLENANVDNLSADILVIIDNEDIKATKLEMECENDEQKTKPRRKSRLSLNSEVKIKDKPKEDLGQVSIKSFFKKMSPKINENSTNNKDGDKNKDCLTAANNIQEVEENNKETQLNGIQKECDVESDDSTFSKQVRKKKPLKLIKKVKSEKKIKGNKNKNENEQVKEYINGKSTSETKKKVVAKVKKNLEENTSKEEDIEDSDDESKALDKKVRFSESIQEYSPEPFKKLSKATKTDNCIGEIETKESEEREEKIIEIIDGKETEFTGAENAAKTETRIANVFTFMMDSRNRSIGQNLIGKEAEKSEDDDELQKENKKKLSARKGVFQEWADAKGGKKKRLEDQEKGVVIENKLKIRARRLKKMLTQNPSPDVLNSDDKSNEEILIKKQKVKRIIESELEEEITETKNSPEKLNKKEKRKRKTKNVEIISLQGEDNAVVLGYGDAVDDEMFSRSKKPKLIIVSDNSNSDCNTNSQDNFSTENQKNILSTSLHQTELSSFFGVLNKSNHSLSGNKSKSKLQMKRSKTDAEIDKKISKLTLKKNEDNRSSILTSNDSSNQSNSEHDDLNAIEIEINENLEKTDIQNILTPRSFKKWKMRLKLNLEDIDDQEIERLVQPPIHSNKNTGKEITVSSDFDSDSSNEPLSVLRNNLKKSGVKLNNIKPIKLAPLFIKAKPKSKKPKLDEATIEARRKFLHSEIPNSLKKTMKKQQPKLEETECEIFPAISHVRIKPTKEQLANNSINFWNLPSLNIILTKDKFHVPYFEPLTLGSFTSVTTSTINNNNNIQLHVPQRLPGLKNYLTQIKNDNPDYPVYKAFKLIYKKSVVSLKVEDQLKTNEIPSVKKRKSRKRKTKVPPEDNEVKIINTPSIDPSKQEIWTDLYKPSSSEEIFGNHTAIIQLKSWLETWLEFSEEINMQRSKHKRDDSDSGSDFEGGDVDSRDNVKLPGNTVILYGPYGSGKTMTVYALCNELGINVLELNASNKRTGKSLLQELQEATQSHQVRKKDSNNALTSFIKKDDGSKTSTPQSSQNSDSQSSQSNKKMCLLLIEDVDIVFEQDENFINALNQLLTTSKRPVILTTTDPNCLHLKRFFTQYKIISFNGLSAKVLAVWLQLICLIEGLCVSKDVFVQLLEQNNGDVRHTLLQLQFWVRSGGQLNPKLNENNSQCIIINDNSESISEENYLFKDDSSNISWINDENSEQHKESVAETFVHNDCLESFGYFKNYNELYSIYSLDLGDAWWNLSSLFGITLTCKDKVNKEENSSQKNSELLNNGDEVDNKIDIINLKNVSNIFEVLAMTDVTYTKLNIDCNSEPVHKNRDGKISNSVELSECIEGYSLNRDLASDWCHHLFDGYVNSYKRFPEKRCSFAEAKRWRTKQYKCNEAFQEAIPSICRLDHNSVNTDYLSALRIMARSEMVRASNNSKRKNRFYNYLRGVGINCKDALFKTACDVFQRES